MEFRAHVEPPEPMRGLEVWVVAVNITTNPPHT